MKAPLGLAALALFALAAPAAGQSDETDPRYAKDPRVAETDPRERADPRQADVDAQASRRNEQLTGAALYDDLFERGEFGDLGRAINDRPWELLPYLDGLCEEWLGLESPPGNSAPPTAERAAALRDKIERVAALADRGIGDTAFVAWTARVLAWNAAQVEAYREAQALYVEALALFGNAETVEATKAALTPLQRALDRLRPLGTTWETTMSLTLIGRIQMANHELAAARSTMADALKQGRSLRDLDAVWNGLSVMYDSALADGNFDVAIELLKDQYRISLETGDEATAQQVVSRLVALDAFREKTGF